MQDIVGGQQQHNLVRGSPHSVRVIPWVGAHGVTLRYATRRAR